MSALHVIYAPGKGEIRLLKKVKQGVKRNDKVALITLEIPINHLEDTNLAESVKQPKEGTKDDNIDTDADAMDMGKNARIESHLKGVISSAQGVAKITSRPVSAIATTSSGSSDKLSVLGNVEGKIVGKHVFSQMDSPRFVGETTLSTINPHV